MSSYGNGNHLFSPSLVHLDMVAGVSRALLSGLGRRHGMQERGAAVRALFPAFGRTCCLPEALFVYGLCISPEPGWVWQDRCQLGSGPSPQPCCGCRALQLPGCKLS